MLAARLRGVFTAKGAGRIDEEIAAHVDLLAAEFVRRGMTPEAAAREARRQFGGTAQVAEAWRDQRTLPVVETFAKDLRYAVRQLCANPGFAAAAILTLALGIGANTAIFRVLDAVVLRSLPVREPEKLVLLQGWTNGKTMGFNYPLFHAMAERQQAVEGMFAFCDFPQKDADFTSRLVTGGYFQVLGIQARVGRMFTNEDDSSTAPAVAVISYGYWQRAFGGSVEALGRTVRIDKSLATIVGVAPPEFFGERVGSAPDVWLVMNLAPQVFVDLLHSPGYSLLTVMARLRADVPQAQAQAALNGLYGQLTDLHIRFSAHDEHRLELESGSQGVRDLQKKFSRPLAVLMGIVGLVLLIACSNLANLLLARSTARTHEMGVRLALGAGRGRLIRQLLTESLLLAAAGSLVGFLMAAWGSRALVTLASAGQNWKLSIEGGWRVIAFTAGVSLAAACLFGLVPALTATRLNVSAALQSNGRTQSGSRSRQATVRAFVVAQVAISLLLVSGASLLVRSFWNILHQDYGYRQEGVLWVRTPFVPNLWRQQKPALPALYQRLNQIPGVRSAAIAASGPFGNIQNPVELSLPGRPSQESDEARMVDVSARYFETMGIPILAGRPITEEDREGTKPVAVISETAARLLFGRTNPVGRFFTNGKQFDATKIMEIVGVAHDIRFTDAREPFSTLVYKPLAQQAGPLSSVMLRTSGNPALFADAARAAIREVAPALHIGEVRPLGAIIGDSLRQERMMALISGAFGLLALVLASVGLYGVIAYGVERRTQEIGIRLALGASRMQVSGLLLREVGVVLAIGMGLGGVATMALGRSVKAMLFGLTPHDPAMLAAAVGLLTVVALVAGYVPARRAGRLDPVSALRQE